MSTTALITIAVALLVALPLLMVVRRRRTSVAASPQCVDLNELRRDLTARSENSEDYQKSIEPLLQLLEHKYGNQVPVEELQHLISAEKESLKNKMKGLVGTAAAEGRSVSVEGLRQTMEKTKAAYAGNDPDAYKKTIDSFVESLRAEYGEQIPVDQAFKLLQKLEGAAGQTDTINQP